MSAGGGYPPPTDATALLIHISLAQRLDVMSMGKLANFLPVGKDFTIPARNFLPVGKGLRGLPGKVTKRHDGRGRGTQWQGRQTTMWIVAGCFGKTVCNFGFVGKQWATRCNLFL